MLFTAAVHKRRGADGQVVKQWTQRGLSVSRVMQAWREIVVRNRLLQEDASAPYLQRKHYVSKDSGYAHAAAANAGPEGIPPSVLEKMKDARNNA